MKTSLFLAVVIGIHVSVVASNTHATQGKVDALSKLITMSSDSSFISKHLAEHNKKINSEGGSLGTPENNHIVNSLKANDIRMTIGTSILNAIHIKVTDENDAPVSDQKVIISTNSELIVVPGWLNGAFFSEMKTNDKGEFVGMLVSNYHSIKKNVIRSKAEINNTAQESLNLSEIYGTSGVIPTIDEFDARIPGDTSYQLMIDVAGTKLNYHVDVDMGPSLVISSDSESMFYSSQWVGMKTKQPVGMTLIHYKRTSDCKKLNEVGEYLSTTDWISEDFSLKRIRKIEVPEIQHTVIAERYDRNNNSIKLIDDFINPDSNTSRPVSGSNYIRSNESQLMRHSVVMDHVMGDILVAYNVPEIKIEYYDRFCMYQENIHKLPINTRSFKNASYPITNIIPLRCVSPEIKVVIKDDMPPEPDPDPLPFIKSYSGMNVDKLVVTLNDNVIFGGATKDTPMKQYPNYIETIADHKSITEINKDVLMEMAPGIFEFIYYPTFEELNVGGINTVKVRGIEDKVGNKSPDTVNTFTIP